MFGSESFSEGKLRIEISVLVNGLEKIKGAEKVCVRIHSGGCVLFAKVQLRPRKIGIFANHGT